MLEQIATAATTMVFVPIAMFVSFIEGLLRTIRPLSAGQCKVTLQTTYAIES